MCYYHGEKSNLAWASFAYFCPKATFLSDIYPLQFQESLVQSTPGKERLQKKSTRTGKPLGFPSVLRAKTRTQYLFFLILPATLETQEKKHFLMGWLTSGE